MIWEDICAFAAFNALYATYLETNPKMGGVILRPDEEGNKKVSLKSYWNFIKEPFCSKNKHVQKELWKPKNWDINYFMSALIFMFGYKSGMALIDKIKNNEIIIKDLDNPIFDNPPPLK
jgi:hypothetical protein